MKFEDVVGKLYPQRAKGVEPDKIPWDNPDYVFEVKYDGDRRLLYITPQGILNSSRSKSKETGLPVSKTDNVPHIRDLSIPQLYGTILDCEFIHPLGFQDGVRKIMGCLPEKAIERQNEMGLIEVRLFDIIALNGEFLIDKPYWERKKLLSGIYEAYLSHIKYINLVETCEGTQEELQEKLVEIINDGGEGMVAKNIHSKYRLSTEKCQSPLKNAWIKVKREFNGDFVILGFDEPTKEYTGDHLDTHPYWEDEDGDKMMLRGIDEALEYSHHNNLQVRPITEFHYKDWIGAIRFGEYENGVLVDRGSVTGITKDLRAELTANPDKYIGKVIEISGMERTKDKAVRQPVFERFRGDKEPTDCQYENQKG